MKQNTKICEICENKKMELIPYGNHGGKINTHLIKHALARIILPTLTKKIPFLKKYEYTNIFSPFYMIRYFKTVRFI